MILLIDNYDSFTYNLVQYIGALEPDIRVVRNDVCTLAEIEEMHPQAIVISPGPGKPSDAGICIEAIRYFKDKSANSWCVSGTSPSVKPLEERFLMQKT